MAKEPTQDSEEPHAEPALLAEGLQWVQVELVCGLLEAEGIPFLVDGPDFDVAELGSMAHASLRSRQIYVPQTALERARAVLAEAMGDDAPGRPSAD